MSSYTQTERIAHLHMTTWDMESADPGSINAVIGFAKVRIQEDDLVIAAYKECGEDVPGELIAEKDFWVKYIEWGKPIVERWWGNA